MNMDVDDASIRNNVIKMLSEQHPLSAKEIFELIILNQKNASYPAVYKTLKMLTRERKLIKQNRKFSLNLDWIRELKSFSEKVEENYTHKLSNLPSLDKFEQHKTYTFKFKNLAEAEEYRKRLQTEYISEKRIFPYCAIYNHLRSPVIQSEKSITTINSVVQRRINSYLAVASDTPIDRWCAKFYSVNRTILVKVGLIIPTARLCETMVLGDVIIQTFIPENIQNYMDYIYKKSKKVDDINIFEFYEKAYKTSSKPKVVIIKNDQIANHIRVQIMNYFRKK
ncbi:MAG: hypothetical protein HY831_04245 [Candidatus Aenigmarchaeota archaeon]|nr:hypothetical protein [Candidatus Aenigmarchaeota archaeon]